MSKLIATAATRLDALYDTHGVDIFEMFEDGEGDHFAWLPAENPTIEDREIDEETGEVIDPGQWDIDEADDILTAHGYRRTQPWQCDRLGDSTQSWAEIEQVSP
ncbi:hypothetical protein [Brachybacterium sp. UMB0905]|uniref:hypothetical protein n=1 Tax=Brachybacterium sp. UMB0905 TaxID=2069310 RepID=UPI000C800760|nr:hypothetical protein [Brachybacterium sp. UMB0905]PMC76395.1 hypothetical protein CJ197_04360 [Brachybacterium sp. UMB0905]